MWELQKMLEQVVANVQLYRNSPKHPQKIRITAECSPADKGITPAPLTPMEAHQSQNSSRSNLGNKIDTNRLQLCD